MGRLVQFNTLWKHLVVTSLFEVSLSVPVIRVLYLVRYCPANKNRFKISDKKTLRKDAHLLF